MSKFIRVLFVVFFSLAGQCYAATTNGDLPLQHISVDVSDKVALQRGATLFMNYCSGCHGLRYLRYKNLAEDIGLTSASGEVYQDLVQRSLVFTGARLTESIVPAMAQSDAKRWFGIMPPDLSLAERVHSADWIYTYLLSFYTDKKTPWGINNLLRTNTSMPNVLGNLQGQVVAVYGENGKADHLQWLEDGLMSQHQFKQTVSDLVTFLSYTAEPIRLQRQWLGFWVIGFLLVLALITWQLKRAYWRDIH